MKTKVLVTGANGQLGKTINELFRQNHDGIEFTFMSKLELDISKKEDVLSLFKTSKFHYCINCAAYTNVEQAEKSPKTAYKVNAEGVKNLAEACKFSNVILIHISTDYVFDGEKNKPYTINDTPNPINEYGKSKLKGEQYIQSILNDFFIIRTSWLYSKKHGRNFYKTILKKAKSQKEALSITGEQIGCPTDATNVSNLIYNLIRTRTNSFGIFHFSDNLKMTWYDFAKNILIENGLFYKINLVKADNYVTFAKRPKYSVLANNII